MSTTKIGSVSSGKHMVHFFYTGLCAFQNSSNNQKHSKAPNFTIRSAPVIPCEARCLPIGA